MGSKCDTHQVLWDSITHQILTKHLQIASAVFWAAFPLLLLKTWSLFQFPQLVNSPKNPGKINLPFPNGWANPDSGFFFSLEYFILARLSWTEEVLFELQPAWWINQLSWPKASVCYFQLMPGTSNLRLMFFLIQGILSPGPSDKSLHWNASVKDDNLCYSSCCGEIPWSVFHLGKAGVEKGHTFALGGVEGMRGSCQQRGLWGGRSMGHHAPEPPCQPSPGMPHWLENLKKGESWWQENIIYDLYTLKLTIKPWTREASQSEILGEKGKAKCSCNPCF